MFSLHQLHLIQNYVWQKLESFVNYEDTRPREHTSLIRQLELDTV